MTVLSPRTLNRTTLARQSLLARGDHGVVEAARALCLLQAQAPPSVHLSLWSRVSALDLEAVDDAIRSRALVRASLFRITLHTVPADDHAVLHAAMAPALRASRVNDRRYRDTGMLPAQADALLPALHAFCAEPRAKADVLAWLEGVDPSLDAEWCWWALRAYAGLTQAPTDDVWAFGAQPTYLAPPGGDAVLDTDLTEGSPGHLAAVAAFIRRYLRGFGPASAHDVTQACLLPQRVIRPALALLDDELVRYRSEDGRELVDLAGGAVTAADTPAPPRLLPMWDSTLLVYRDRSRILPEPYRKVVIRTGGDTLPTILVDGYVAGVWRPVEAGIEVSAFASLTDRDWAGLEEEAVGLWPHLERRDPDCYGRYRRWWDRLPADRDVRCFR